MTFSIDLNDIPSEIADRVGKLRSDLYLIEEDIESIKESLKTDHVSAVLPMIEKWRENLARLDEKMAECGVVLAEYQKATAEIYLAKQDANQIKHTNQQLESDIAEAERRATDEETERVENGETS